LFSTANLYQNDPQWKDVTLGNQTHETIGSWGCLLTSMTMALNGAGYSETPESVNEKMKHKGGFQDALIVPAMLPMIFPNVIYRGFESYEDHPAPIDQIDVALQSGKPVIVQVDWNPEEGIQTHWLLLKEKRGDDYIIYDPYRYKGDAPDKELTLTSRYKYQGTDPAQVISGVVWYEINGNSSNPPKQPKTALPKDAVEVYIAEDDLALRMDPALSGYLIRRMISGDRLSSLESVESTSKKVGAQNQWLHVQTHDGEQGYTAAWYLVNSLSELQKKLHPETNSNGSSKKTLIVSPSVNGLAFRSKPVIAPETNLKYVQMADELFVLDPYDQAIKKLGVVGEWLKVKDPSGQEGYIAAWYVSA
jgi:hypothetical protein